MFFLSFGLILLLGFTIGYLLNKIKIPGLVGMIIIGMLFGPYVLNIIDVNILNISSELRQIALVIILTRSGLNLDVESLKKIGRPAILMCFLPATFEIVAVAGMSYFLLKLSLIECLLLGSVLAAVSPAVVSPRMVKLIEEGYGTAPKLVLAGSSVDDVYTIILFYTFLAFSMNDSTGMYNFIKAPLSIILGIGLGLIVGLLLSFVFKKTCFKKTINVLILLGTSFLLVGLEICVKEFISISSLLSILVVGIVILFFNKAKANELSNSYNSIWIFFEIILFVLVGAEVNIKYLAGNGFYTILILLIGLLFRSLGVFLCLIKTEFNKKEKLFAIISYLPKATVQASIGGIALACNLPGGEVILAVSVLAIIITAPLGALLIDVYGKKLLKSKNLIPNG